MSESDALIVARWCWPERLWVEWGDGKQASDVTGRVDVQGNPIGACNWWPRDFEFERDSFADAEQVVIARGLAERYGSALALEVLGPVWELQPGPTICNITGVEFAKLATAPLPVRLRALAAVARENPHCGYDQHKEAKP